MNDGSNEIVECTSGWYERCSQATSHACKCECGGEHHGIALPGRSDNASMPLTAVKVFTDYNEPQEILVRFNDVPVYIILERFSSGDIKTNIPRKYVYHSPTGFEWGYAGSGPGDLALNILGMYLGPFWSWRFHHTFKQEFIASMPLDGGRISSLVIMAWIYQQFRHEKVEVVE